jgi:D-xylose transport system substrate-binding protein
VKAQDWVAGQITQFKNKIKAVYSAGDGTAVAVIAAFKAVNLHVPPVTGQDANLSAIQQILAGDQYMTVYKDFKPEAEKAAEVAVSLAKGESPQGDTTVKTKTGADIQSFLLVPVAVTLNNIESTVVAGGFYTASAICTADYAAACVKAGVK